MARFVLQLIILASLCVHAPCVASEYIEDDEGKQRNDSVYVIAAEKALSDHVLTEKNLKDSIVHYHRLLGVEPKNKYHLERLGKHQTACKLIEDAFLTYTRLIGIDANHPEACLFLGYFHYARGKKLLDKEDANYKKITNPRKMEYAAYQNKIKQILEGEYATASTYLQKVSIKHRPKIVDTILKNILHRISYPNPLRK
ncbi:MAG: hypothetical protein LBD45_07565 [Bacteroidales bacterium]|jgi:hypothetical protein|nr:hypothetical protein [Bacteroidales bacterium]